jgi:glucokinase
MFLGGDLGGTKTLLALADGDGRIIRQQRYASADYDDFVDLLADFLAGEPINPAIEYPAAGSSSPLPLAGEGAGVRAAASTSCQRPEKPKSPAATLACDNPLKGRGSHITAACFGLAGPTDGRSAQLTYLPWRLVADDLERRFAISRILLANDFAAAANGLAKVAPQDLLTLQAGEPDDSAPRVLIGPGTGLGVAGLLPEGRRFRVVPGEGGHFGFAPQTSEEGELSRWLLKESGRATAEDVLSGPGLARIYRFLGGSIESPATIGAAMVRGDEPLARATLRIWLGCLGGFAGDMALHWLACGGVYLAGGVAARLLPHVDCTPLLAAFTAKREHAGLMPAMPLHLVSDQELGLKGALAMAAGLTRDG